MKANFFHEIWLKICKIFGLKRSLTSVNAWQVSKAAMWLWRYKAKEESTHSKDVDKNNTLEISTTALSHCGARFLAAWAEITAVVLTKPTEW